jgi:hypothetical protein
LLYKPENRGGERTLSASVFGESFLGEALNLYELDPPGCKGDHAEEQQSMPPAGDIRRAVGPLTVADGQVDDLQVELGRTEDQVEVAERVEVSKVGAVGGDLLIVLLPQDLRTA